MKSWEHALIKLISDHNVNPLSDNEMNDRIQDIIIEHLMDGEKTIENLNWTELNKFEKKIRDRKDNLGYNRSNIGIPQIKRRLRIKGFKEKDEKINLIKPKKDKILAKRQPDIEKLNILTQIQDEVPSAPFCMALVFAKGNVSCNCQNLIVL